MPGIPYRYYGEKIGKRLRDNLVAGFQAGSILTNYTYDAEEALRARSRPRLVAPLASRGTGGSYPMRRRSFRRRSRRPMRRRTMKRRTVKKYFTKVGRRRTRTGKVARIVRSLKPVKYDTATNVEFQLSAPQPYLREPFTFSPSVLPGVNNRDGSQTFLKMFHVKGLINVTRLLNADTMVCLVIRRVMLGTDVESDAFFLDGNGTPVSSGRTGHYYGYRLNPSVGMPVYKKWFKLSDQGSSLHSFDVKLRLNESIRQTDIGDPQAGVSFYVEMFIVDNDNNTEENLPIVIGEFNGYFSYVDGVYIRVIQQGVSITSLLDHGSRKMGSQCTRWVYTLNNSEEGDKERLLSLNTTYHVIGVEVAASGTRHYQGSFILVAKARLATIKRDCGIDRLHLEPMRGAPEQAADYCKKSVYIRVVQQGVSITPLLDHGPAATWVAGAQGGATHSTTRKRETRRSYCRWRRYIMSSDAKLEIWELLIFQDVLFLWSSKGLTPSSEQLMWMQSILSQCVALQSKQESIVRKEETLSRPGNALLATANVLGTKWLETFPPPPRPEALPSSPKKTPECGCRMARNSFATSWHSPDLSIDPEYLSSGCGDLPELGSLEELMQSFPQLTSSVQPQNGGTDTGWNRM
ncbi:Replication-associated protein [Porphyridium purpureum]|uniref:Replication-associated protein n=1 Tax=Porphyridium purpureum TaxID=35688 RepID=A0A5J4Z9F9_PORPP|nr:Replication-associated protein [Porphyridium purpureum]|eukprot:POR3993..scf295_1